MQVLPPKHGSRGFILAFLSNFASCGDLRPEALVASAPLGSLVQVMTLAPVALLAAELFAVFFVAMDFLSNDFEIIIGDVLSCVQKKSHQIPERSAAVARRADHSAPAKITIEATNPHKIIVTV